MILAVPLLYGNWIGLAVGACIILAMVLGLYLRAIMTVRLYERTLNLICMLSIAAVSCALTETVFRKTLHLGEDINRFSAMFFYPNYYGTIISMVIIICAYKILTEKGDKGFFCLVAAVNVIGVYLCKSIFIWAEVFIGIFVLLLILKKFRLLSAWILGAAFVIFLIQIADIELIPRMSEVEITTLIRVKIWMAAWQAIKASPLIGHGFMSYLFLYNDNYHGRIIPHAHSLYLDLLMNVGIIGIVLLLTYFLPYYKNVVRICMKEKQPMITSLILAISAAAFAHGIADITLLWVQTLPLFLIILSGLGALEKK
jgi:O-antigen ligase